ncbi:MAG: hypothetical protein IPJ30_10000 [Acidobacteria bacterium]|nr:hypothetical protein [Acidobacteriota bacterium]
MFSDGIFAGQPTKSGFPARWTTFWYIFKFQNRALHVTVFGGPTAVPGVKRYRRRHLFLAGTIRDKAYRHYNGTQP